MIVEPSIVAFMIATPGSFSRTTVGIEKRAARVIIVPPYNKS